MLVLAPVMCILASIGVNHVLTTYMKNLENVVVKDKKGRVKHDNSYPAKNEVREDSSSRAS